MIFVNEVQPKSTFLGHDYGRSSLTSNTGRFGVPAEPPPLPCEPVVLCRHGYNSLSSHIYEEIGIHEFNTNSKSYC
uniref:Uncharacterized protein n=1 Tax=Arundo donax TaxID=35708 RepID=A0A0A8Y993_ARUDO